MSLPSQVDIKSTIISGHLGQAKLERLLLLLIIVIILKRVCGLVKHKIMNLELEE